MNDILAYGWIICFIIAYLIQVIDITSVNNVDDINRVRVFLQLIGWILSVTGFIIFIVWLIRFNNTKVLNTMWIVSLITWIVLTGIAIFMVGNVSSKLLSIPNYLLGYSFIIFIGTLITFLVKNK